MARPAPVSLCCLNPSSPVLQIREIQTSNAWLCDYELHQRPGTACKPNETSGREGVQVGRSQRKTGSARNGEREKDREAMLLEEMRQRES